MRSMTGFGQARGDNGRYAVAVSLRAVNGRYLDLNFRLRDEYRALEADLRDLLSSELARGRIEAGVEIRPLVLEPRIEVRSEAVRALHRALGTLVEEEILHEQLTLGDLLRLPALIEVRVGEESWEEADSRLVADVAREALAELVAAREREGEKLTALLTERLAALDALAAELGPLRSTAAAEAAEALRRRVGEILGEVPVDEQRLAQEIAVLADRVDVSEELDRLRTHLGHFRKLLESPGPTGKRLDFLAQEIFRELNTLGAKCRDGEVVRRVLDAKALAEQIREQIQNLE